MNYLKKIVEPDSGSAQPLSSFGTRKAGLGNSVFLRRISWNIEELRAGRSEGNTFVVPIEKMII